MRFRGIFFLNDPATTVIYTLSLHDALPICARARPAAGAWPAAPRPERRGGRRGPRARRAADGGDRLRDQADLAGTGVLQPAPDRPRPARAGPADREHAPPGGLRRPAVPDLQVSHDGPRLPRPR